MSGEQEHLADPIRAWLSRIEEITADNPDRESTDLAVRRRAARELSDRLAVDFTLPVPGGVTSTDASIPGPESDILVRVHRPDHIDGPAPTQVSLHGGGGWAGTVHERVNDQLLTRRALAADIQIVAVEYALAPERPFPAAQMDTIAVVQRLAQAELGADPTRIGLGGVSAGGWVAAGAALALRDLSLPLVHLCLEVPAVALRLVDDDEPAYGDITEADIDALRHLVLGPGGPRRDDLVPAAYASPLDVDDLTGLPPTLIMVSQYDALRGGGVALAERLHRAGVPTTLVRGAGHLHATGGLTAVWDRARAWDLAVVEQLRTAFGTGTTEGAPSGDRGEA